MFKSISLVIVVSVLVGCQPDSKQDQSGQIPRVGPFEASTNGEWISKCQAPRPPGRDRDRGGQNDFPVNNGYIEKLVFNNGKGTRQLEFREGRNCQGAIVRATLARPLTYTVTSVSGNTSQVTINYQGQVPQLVTIILDGVSMFITSPNGTEVEYSRPNVNIGHLDFESYASGTWTTLNCYKGRNFTSYEQVIIFAGYGQGSFYNKTYQGRGCQGPIEITNNLPFTYLIQNFINGTGVITVEGQTKNISFSNNSLDNEMTWGLGINSIVYTKTGY
jgi:hypothetical protein